MTVGHDRKTTPYLFGLAALLWALTTFPCVHLLDLYNYHHMEGIGLHPEFVAPYYRTITLATLGFSLLGTLLVWFLTRRLTSESRDSVLWGILSGVVFAPILWTVISPAFRRVSAYPLDWGNFLYAGFLAGAVVGEIRSRSLRSQSSVPRSPDELRQDFYIIALMAWAVILKVFGCFELVTIPAGRPVTEVGAHLVRLLSVALWALPLCQYLWKHPPKYAIHMTFFACAAGVLLPPLVSYVLYFPLGVLLYMGLPPVAFAALWGITFLNAGGAWIWKPVLLLVPGLTWGLIVGSLRWRYLQVEKKLSLMPQKFGHSDARLR